jgi:hypothetical protein
MATKVFRDTDAGAPVLNGIVGSFVAVMKHCLLQAGWTLAWEDTGAGKLVMRNSVAVGGSGCYVRILDNEAHYAYVQVYEDMTGIDTGFAPATSMNPGVVILKSTMPDTVSRAYVVFADERTFYGCIAGAYSGFPLPNTNFLNANWAVTYHTAFGGGDYECITAGEPGVFVSGRALTGFYELMLSGLGRCGDSNPCFQVSRNGKGIATPSTAFLGRLEGLAGTKYPPDGITGGGHSFAWGAIASTEYSEAAIPSFIATDASGFSGRMRGLYTPMGARNSSRSASETVMDAFDPAHPFGVIRGYANGPGDHINCSWYLFVSQGDW